MLENCGATNGAEDSARGVATKGMAPESVCDRVGAASNSTQSSKLQEMMNRLRVKPDHSNGTNKIGTLCLVSAVAASLR